MLKGELLAEIEGLTDSAQNCFSSLGHMRAFAVDLLKMIAVML